MSARPVSPRAWPAAVATVVAAVAIVGLPARATYGARTSADEPQYLLTATSLAEDFDLDISDELREQRYLPYHEIGLDPQTYPLDESGRQVSPHDPLLPALLAAPVALGGWSAAKLALAAVAAAAAALTAWLAHCRFGVRRSAAAVTTVACYSGIPLAAYGTQIYPEIAAGAATLLVVTGLTAPRETPNAAPALSRPDALTLGALIALPWLSVKYVAVAAIGGVALLIRLRNDRRALLLALAIAGTGAATYLAAHQWIYGGWTAYATGDHFVGSGEIGVIGTDVDVLGRSRRLAGLLVDRRFGIAAWAPVWFLLPVAAVAGWSRSATRDRLLIALVATTWLTATFVALTMHGWWIPGRQLVVALPAAAVLIAIWAHGSARRLRIVAALGVVGLVNWLVLAVEASTGRRALIVDFDETASWPYRLVAPVLPDGIEGGLRNDIALAVWAALIVALTAIGHRSAVRRAGSELIGGEKRRRRTVAHRDRLAEASEKQRETLPRTT